MKRLESVILVQFYLFEQTELRLREITGIFGRNGSGKSAALDAVQIAMFGGNANLSALNAQADERSATTRTIRAYCLGQHGPAPEHRVRDVATTYITLVWRDTVTNEPLSMGVCLSSSADSETHTVLGRYVLRGIELSMGDHIETVDNKERPREWRTFRHQLVERSRVTGEDPCFDDARRYIQAALLALRGSGGTPAYEAFTRAFRFALKMRFDKPVDQIVRHDVLEARPTNVRRFRELTDTFRSLNEMVNHVDKKVRAGEKVIELFADAEREHRRAVTWKGLSLSAQRTAAAGVTEAAAAARERAEAAHDAKRREAQALAERLATLDRDLEHAKELQEAHGAHKDHARSQSEFIRSSSRVQSRRTELKNALDDAGRLLRASASNARMQDYRDELIAAAGAIQVAAEAPDAVADEQVDKLIRPAVKLVAKIVSELFTTLGGVSRKIEETQTDLEQVGESLKRARAGHAPLGKHAQALVSELRQHGLSPTPVCDLVRVLDPDWQPVIESFLGPNVEALLIDESEEARAFDIYRQLGGPRAVYGVKIVASSKYRGNVGAAPGSVAALIDGENLIAVSFLRRILGDLRCVESNEHALAGARTLTKDGMLVSGETFERIRPVGAADLKMGGGGAGQIDSLTHQERELNRALQILQAERSQVDQLRKALSPLATDHAVALMKASVAALHEARRDLEAAQLNMADVADVGYLALHNKVVALKAALPAAKNEAALAKEVEMRAEGDVKVAAANESNAVQALNAIAAEADACRERTDYDKLFASEQWDKLLERFDEDFAGMAKHCGDQADGAGRRSSRAAHAGTGLFGQYLAEYREAPGQEIIEDWRKALSWMTAQVERLNNTELQQYKEQAEDAYRASQETFRTDVAIALSNNIDAQEKAFERLNQALSDCPVFSNGERYEFVASVRPSCEKLLTFVKNVAAHGATGDLLGSPGEIPAEFESLLREKVTPGAAGVSSALDDYREFFVFDVKILRENPTTRGKNVVGLLSKRLGTGSGGEHRAPLYVIAGAALSSAYRLDRRNRDGMSLILLDEAFDKMDMTNIVATMRYLEQLGLQVLLAGPGENLPTLNAFLHRYYDIQRDADYNVVQMEGHDVSEEMRLMFREDLPEFNPDILTQEIAALRAPLANAAAATAAAG